MGLDEPRDAIGELSRRHWGLTKNGPRYRRNGPIWNDTDPTLVRIHVSPGKTTTASSFGATAPEPFAVVGSNRCRADRP